MFVINILKIRKVALVTHNFSCILLLIYVNPSKTSLKISLQEVLFIFVELKKTKRENTAQFTYFAHWGEVGHEGYILV